MITIDSEEAMKAFGTDLGRQFHGGEIIQLIGDVGAGKTTLVKGIAKGMGIDEEVQSPSFTISRVYEAPHGLRLAHYDFYRLNEAGIMANELAEDVSDPQTVTVVEWADVVENVLPEKHIAITLTAPSETMRQLEIKDEYGTLTT